MTSKQIKKNRKKNKHQAGIVQNILFTLAYYDVLGYNPTTFFLWRYLIDCRRAGQAVDYQTVQNCLFEAEREGVLRNKNGFWFFRANKGMSVKEREKGEKAEIIERRYREQIQQRKISSLKIKKARFWAKTAKWLPYIREVFLIGALSIKRGDRQSDWDVLVITAPRRIWLGRFLITVWWQLIGKRRHGRRVKDRFCLNQFMTEDSLHFAEESEYAANEILFAQPLLGAPAGQNKMLQRLVEANLTWLVKLKPNVDWADLLNQSPAGKAKSKLTDRLVFWLKRNLEKVGEATGVADRLNRYLRRVMIKKIEKNPKTHWRGADIRYDDQQLVFLPLPQRDKVRRRAAEKINSNIAVNEFIVKMENYVGTTKK